MPGKNVCKNDSQQREIIVKMFETLIEMSSILYNGIIPKPDDDVRTNYNCVNAYAFSLFSKQDLDKADFMINHGKLQEEQAILEAEIMQLVSDIQNIFGVANFQEWAFQMINYLPLDNVLQNIVNTNENLRQLLKNWWIKWERLHQKICNLLKLADGSILKMKAGSGYDEDPEINSPKIFLQICLGALLESLVINEIEDVVVDQDQELTLKDIFARRDNIIGEDYHFGNLTSQDRKESIRQLHNFRKWIANAKPGEQYPYGFLHQLEIDLLNTWGEVILSKEQVQLQKLSTVVQNQGLLMVNRGGNGDCLFRAILDHFQPSATDLDLQRLATGLRKLVANAYPDYINRMLDFFDDPQTMMNIIDHANVIKMDGEYATETDITIITRLLNVEIAVHYPDGSINKFYDGNIANGPLFTIHIGYVNGHYVAIRAQNGVAPICNHRYQSNILNMLTNIENNIPNNAVKLFAATDTAQMLTADPDVSSSSSINNSNNRVLHREAIVYRNIGNHDDNRITENTVANNHNNSNATNNANISNWRNLCMFSRAAIPVLGSIAVGMLINNGCVEYVTKKIYDYFNG